MIQKNQKIKKINLYRNDLLVKTVWNVIIEYQENFEITVYD